MDLFWKIWRQAKNLDSFGWMNWMCALAGKFWGTSFTQGLAKSRHALFLVIRSHCISYTLPSSLGCPYGIRGSGAAGR